VSRKFTPFDVGERFRIVPRGSPPGGDARIELVMAAGAFGSGEHETTASCLQVLETLPEVQGARALDLGSGTGILALAALRLGARFALCVDPDPAAVRTAQLNCELNGVSARVEHLCGTVDQVAAEPFDLILANLWGDVLLAAAEALVSKASPGATLVLSGILHEYNFDVRRRYENLGCSVARNRMLEEFTTLLLRRG
jgi:ribosomal protein L11 methyltransferase